MSWRSPISEKCVKSMQIVKACSRGASELKARVPDAARDDSLTVQQLLHLGVITIIAAVVAIFEELVL